MKKKKYRIYLTISANIEVSACSREDAFDQAMNMHYDQLDNQAANIEWEVTSIREVK